MDTKSNPSEILKWFDAYKNSYKQQSGHAGSIFEKKGLALCTGIETVKITVKMELSEDISNMSGSLGFIFCSFGVLTSTTKL